MGAISYFGGDGESFGEVQGSSFGEPDGTSHSLELLEGNGHMIVRVQLQGAKDPTDLLMTAEQARAWSGAAQSVLFRLGLDK